MEDRVSTVDCLRGRLLAERVTTQKAKEEADHLENKLMKLENLLKQEAKSRNRAERKLNFLMKKLESLSSSSDITSVSSTASSNTKEQDEKTKRSLSRISSMLPENLQQNDSGIQSSG